MAENKERRNSALQTRFACSSPTRRSGAPPISSTEALQPHPRFHNYQTYKGYVASNQSFKLDAKRCVSFLTSNGHFEEAILQALDGLPSHSQENITVKTPRILHFDKEANTQVMEDLPNSLDLKSFLSDLAKGVSEAAGHALGRSVGTWLRTFHDWAGKPEQGECRSLLAQNESMKQLKFYVNYSMLMDTIADFPGILENSRGVS
ncbi:hypothetical protein N7513_013191 [Penicillium frequentans]|nr:hypothetical protein N7513_013191 [Penicillium glabrum]